jgi:hypothetical protein
MNSISLFAQLAYFFLSTSVSAAAPDQDAVRNALVAKSDRWFVWLIGATIAVGIGVLGEIPECIYEWREWRAHKKKEAFIEKHDRWSIPVAVIGAILVAIGIAVEGIAEYNGATAETAIRKLDGDRVTKAQKDAGTAACSAERAEAAAKILEDRANAVQDEMMWQGSRDIILFKNKDFLHRQLVPFKGQKAVTAICGGQYLILGDQELSQVGGAIGSILADSHWKSTDAFPIPQAGITSVFDDKCSTLGYGVEISVSSEAPISVRKAAETLSASLNVALRQGGNVSKITPQLFGIDVEGRFRVLNPDTVKMEIRMHFPFEGKSWPKGSLEERMREEEKKQATKNQPAK